MKLFNRLIPWLALLSAVTAMNMNHDDMEQADELQTDDTTTATQKLDESSTISSTIEPTAHEVKHKHGLPILETTLTPAERAYWEAYNTTTYFTIDSPKKSALWVHCFTLFATFFILYPIGLVLNNVKSKWYLPILSLNLINAIISLISLKVFGASIPDLYPDNAYAKMSWILLFALITHYCLAVLYSASKWVTGIDLQGDYDQPFIPLDNLGNDSRHDPNESTNVDLERLTSGGSNSPSTLIDSHSDRENKCKDSIENHNNNDQNQPFYDKDSLDLGADNEEADQLYNNLPSFRTASSFQSRDNFLNKIFQIKIVQNLSGKFHALISFLFQCFNYPLLGYLFVYVTTGVSVGCLLGQGNRVFNLLAHFIKGGVFVTLGIFSLARYCGALSKSGLAWNKAVVFKSQVNTRSFWYKLTPHGMITMEGYESFLIFFYGTTNVFLEHLASPGGKWVAKDLQHVSIAFMYIGSGLCGLITEHILSEWRFNQVLLNTNINPAAIHAGSPGYSPNPFPVFTIFWTGILMSQHEQSSQVSTMIHMQWGYLLSFGSFFRLLTFVLLMLVPNKNLNPARPFTELITSFALICGGVIFMQSTDQVVEALEYRGLTSMFTLNVNVGIVALVMGWEMLLMIWKHWLKSRRQI